MIEEPVSENLIEELTFELQKTASQLMPWREKWKKEGKDFEQLLFNEIERKYPALLSTKFEVETFFSNRCTRLFAIRYIDTFLKIKIERNR